jgi:2-keto-4-pentenoate hydratase/2-oxohepta-3-ene-1,7-dioic acid hydratase in catechol pathway
MKLLTFILHNRVRLGVKTDRGILDVTAALGQVSGEGIPQSIHEVILGGKEVLTAMETFVEKALSESTEHCLYLLKEEELKFGPSVTHPGKIICVGLNYRKHAEETKSAIPEQPILFNKFNNALTGHGHDVELPRESKRVDYEAELAIVIGQKAKYIAKENALDYVFGYTCANDLSARDLQMRTAQWMLGKTSDGFAPVGPYLVTAEEVGNPNDLDIKCFVNGEQRQRSHTSDMIFHCDEIVSYISQHFTLEPGDIILTGTPEGVILGYPKDKRVYLQDGDTVTIEIEKLGVLTNRMVAEV